MTAFFGDIGIINIWQLVASTMIFLMLPGPGTFCILTCSAKHGLRGGFASLLGLMLGDAVLMLLAAMGVAALLQTYPTVFQAVQYAGAGYLAYLGIKLLLAKKEEGATMVPFSNAADFRRGFLITILNPKAIVFYMAFFPLFIDPARHHGALTFVTMGGVISTCTLAYGTLLVVAGNAVARRMRQSQRLAQAGSRAAGALLIGFGIKLTIN
jgi:threonine/homoserine/homoserine lactone efflux protein